MPPIFVFKNDILILKIKIDILIFKKIISKNA